MLGCCTPMCTPGQGVLKRISLLTLQEQDGSPTSHPAAISAAPPRTQLVSDGLYLRIDIRHAERITTLEVRVAIHLPIVLG